MLSIYKDEIKDALYPKRGLVDKRYNIVSITPPCKWKSGDIKKLRKQLQLSQSLFAEVLGVSLASVVSWENERSTPSPLACRMFDILSHYPDILLEAQVVDIKK